ncbi:hypothetical protein [Roseateles chitinivorans]|uniref:hypothetical protein n=1 Tax=Roseateles chitinivorans TaxID=2917965 RepID=UPI00117C61C4|nr:hypothetical protein [Roseateles chitinivorans]
MLLLVVAAHVLVISSLWRTSMSTSSARSEAARPSVLVWLLGDRPPLPMKAPSARSPMKGSIAAKPQPATTADGSTPSSEQTGLAGESPDGAPMPNAEGTGGPSGSPAPLRLRPSREAIQGVFAHPATTDPRSNSPRATVDERLAMAFDPTLCILEERLPDGTLRRAYGRLIEAAPSIQREQGLPGKKIAICRP